MERRLGAHPHLVARGAREGEHVAALVGLVFSIAGAGLLVWMARSALRFCKFGESYFAMATFPGVVGGKLAGTVHASVRLDPACEIEVRLSSIRRFQTGSGDSDTTREDVLWQRALRLPPGTAEGVGREVFPVSFDIPSDCRPTDRTEDEDRVLWRLEVSVDLPGLDYEAQFEVPVFRTDESVSTPMEAESAAAPAPAARELSRGLERAGIRVELVPAGKRFVFPRARELGTALFTTLICAVCTGVFIVLVLAEIPWIFTWGWGLCDVLLVWGTLDLWLYTSSIDVRPEGALVSRGMGRLRAPHEPERGRGRGLPCQARPAVGGKTVLPARGSTARWAIGDPGEARSPSLPRGGARRGARADPRSLSLFADKTGILYHL